MAARERGPGLERMLCGSADRGLERDLEAPRRGLAEGVLPLIAASRPAKGYSGRLSSAIVPARGSMGTKGAVQSITGYRFRSSQTGAPAESVFTWTDFLDSPLLFVRQNSGSPPSAIRIVVPIAGWGPFASAPAPAPGLDQYPNDSGSSSPLSAPHVARGPGIAEALFRYSLPHGPTANQKRRITEICFRYPPFPNPRSPIAETRFRYWAPHSRSGGLPRRCAATP